MGGYKVMSDKMYVWELRERGKYEQCFDYTLIKDDEQAFSKIKKLIMGIIREEICECEERLWSLENINHARTEVTRDWLESLQNKLDSVSGYVFMSQFKCVELQNCTIYVDRVEVL